MLYAFNRFFRFSVKAPFIQRCVYGILFALISTLAPASESTQDALPGTPPYIPTPSEGSCPRGQVYAQGRCWQGPSAPGQTCHQYCRDQGQVCNSKAMYDALPTLGSCSEVSQKFGFGSATCSVECSSAHKRGCYVAASGSCAMYCGSSSQDCECSTTAVDLCSVPRAFCICEGASTPTPTPAACIEGKFEIAPDETELEDVVGYFQGEFVITSSICDYRGQVLEFFTDLDFGRLMHWTCRVNSRGQRICDPGVKGPRKLEMQVVSPFLVRVVTRSGVIHSHYRKAR